VMTDLAMETLRGDGLIERLRSEAATATIPIVVLSGDAVAAWTLKASGLVDAVVRKPFVSDALTQCIRDVANRASRQSTVV
jgi:CheY-like chemotaxis protein